MLNKAESISEELSLWRRQPVYGDSSLLIIREPMVNRKTMVVHAFVQSEGEKERSVSFFSASRSSSWGRYVWSCGIRIKDWELIQFSRWLKKEKKIATSFCEFKRLTNASRTIERFHVSLSIKDIVRASIDVFLLIHITFIFLYLYWGSHRVDYLEFLENYPSFIRNQFIVVYFYWRNTKNERL